MKLAEEVREKEIALEAICSEVDRLNIDKEKYVKEMSERV